MAELSAKPRLQSIGLYDLPNEIFTQIIQDAVLFDSRFSLTLCSRRLCELTEPVLYSEFGQRSCRSFPSFLAKLLSRPDLAFQTKFFTATVVKEDDTEMDFAFWNENDWTRLRSAVRAASLDDFQATTWTKAIIQKSWDALIALSLLLVPNLELLVFEGWGSYLAAEPLQYIHGVLDRAADLQNRAVSSQYAMPNLQNVVLTYLGTEDGMPFSCLEPFLRLKSASTLEATDVYGGSTSQSEDIKHQDHVFDTEYLRLNNVDIGHRDMTYRLRQFSRLKKLSYNFVNFPTFIPSTMLLAIEHLKSCLEELQIFPSSHPQYSRPLDGYAIGSLVDFKALVSIDMPATMLIGVRPSGEEDGVNLPGSSVEGRNLVASVPSSLECLSIRDCKPWHVSNIFELVKQSAVHTPLLKRLNLGWERTKPRNEPALPGLSKYQGFSAKEAGDLLTACRQAGITMVINFRQPKLKYVTCDREMTKEEEENGGKHFGCPRGTFRHIFTYPYEGYEECCKEHDCDPVTGRQIKRMRLQVKPGSM